MKTKKTRGFTIVELLTVMAVIAVLIGLLIPALGLVKDHAKEIQQKAQFHGIDVGLEMFKSVFGDYPESFDNSYDSPIAPLTADPFNYCGAEKLAEAMVGWDLLGFHPKSGFRSNGENYFPTGNSGAGYYPVYDTVNGLKGGSAIELDGAANIKAREDEMIELEHANAFKMRDIYGSGNAAGFNEDNFVLCDAYAKKRTSGTKTGMPILYFKARTNYQFQDYRTTDNGDGTSDDIYNYEDNLQLIALGMAEGGTPVPHELLVTPGNPYQKFENMILNTQVQQAANVNRPYKADSYILISAGKDGSYGTADDLFNFDKGVSE